MPALPDDPIFTNDESLQNLLAHLAHAWDDHAAAQVETARLADELDHVRRQIDQHREIARRAAQKVRDIEAEIMSRRQSLARGGTG